MQRKQTKQVLTSMCNTAVSYMYIDMYQLSCYVHAMVYTYILVQSTQAHGPVYGAYAACVLLKHILALSARYLSISN
jgi:hypothetical protein